MASKVADLQEKQEKLKVFFDEKVNDCDREAFRLDLDGFEGPIDMLLNLAREQKVDLRYISILQLADQYLVFVSKAREYSLELAADYLVMAAWLAYLKSKLLLPEIVSEEEPSGDELANALSYQLRRLEAMQNAGKQLLARGQLNKNFFARGRPENFETNYVEVLDVTLFHLLQAYAAGFKRNDARKDLRIEPFNLYSIEAAVESLRKLLGGPKDWHTLWKCLPENLQDDIFGRSAIASTFTAALELVKQGQLSMRQATSFGPIYLREKAKE